MDFRQTFKIFLILPALIAASVSAENIDPYNKDRQYAYGENVGWLNFEASRGPGVQVSTDKVEGFVWAENIGWINLSPDNPRNGGVVNDGAGRLSGYAWGENVGWINFNPVVPFDRNRYGVRIDARGNFSGWAWGENIGWINFNSSKFFAKAVQTCVVSFDDLKNFASAWLDDDVNSPGDMGGTTTVNNTDYSIFASYWQDYCPDGWQLKN